MTEIKYKTFTRGPWRLRAMPYTNVQVIGGDDDGIYPVLWVWYVSRKTGVTDEWFPQGISETVEKYVLDEVYESIHGGVMDVLLIYAGHTWDMLEPSTTISQAQRRIYMNLEEEKLESMLSMTRSEIEELRRAEENDALKGF